MKSIFRHFLGNGTSTDLVEMVVVPADLDDLDDRLDRPEDEDLSDRGIFVRSEAGGRN